jgi:hypothetical protein
MLFTVRDWTQSDGLMRLYFGVSAFAEFYPVDKETVRSMFGKGGWRHMTSEDVEDFVGKLDQLFAGIARDEEAEPLTH